LKNQIEKNQKKIWRKRKQLNNSFSSKNANRMLSKFRESLLKNVKNVLFRAESGFLTAKYSTFGSRKIGCGMDLVKVKLKNNGTEKHAFMGTELGTSKYVYSCYAGSYEEKDALELRESYTQRAVCEIWIEQIKNHLKAGKTLTESYKVNALLWQLSCFTFSTQTIQGNYG
jgi:hypothetical protein